MLDRFSKTINNSNHRFLCEYHIIDLCWSSNFEFNIKLERYKYYGKN